MSNFENLQAWPALNFKSVEHPGFVPISFDAPDSNVESKIQQI
jgi:hypothetical protein